jgi:Flp pilus assembly secretin CpaC
VIVTPYLVDTAARSALKLPGDDIAALAADTDAGAGDAVALSSAPVGQASPADKGFGFIID